MLPTPEDLHIFGVDSQDESLRRRTTELKLIRQCNHRKGSLILYDVA